MVKNIDEIFAVVDEWAISNRWRDGGGWVGYEKPGTSPDHAIQQVRSEMYDFVRVLLEKNLCDKVLEIGLGWHGGTHFLWRQFFNRIITIEPNVDLIKNLTYSLDERSTILCGFSDNYQTAVTIKQILGKEKVDLLFIDGNHDYNFVANDRFLYRNFVKEGGIIAYHDSFQEHLGVKPFLDELRKVKTVYDILNTEIEQLVGISYEFFSRLIKLKFKHRW